MSYELKSVLSIAGSDSSGGAGIQADIKTIQALGLFAQTAITAITAQNTLGVTAVQNVSPEVVEAQIDAVFSDIRPDSVKIGMVSSADIVSAIARALRRNDAKNIVVDPVMVATSGSSLAEGSAAEALRRELFPLADIITPNLQEAQALAGRTISDFEEAESAARAIACGNACAVLIKGGHGLTGPKRQERNAHFADDLLFGLNGEVKWLYGERIDNPNSHGTGCTLSSAIAVGLAKGEDIPTAVEHAKSYISGALAAQLDLGKGSGPLDHFWKTR